VSRNNLFWNILTPVVFMVNIYIIKTYLLDDMSCVYLMCANFIFVLWRIWCVGGLSPYMLFMTTFSFLFIGGHFWGVLFNPQLSLRVGSFLDPQPTSNSEWRETLIYLILFLYMTLLGYLYIYGRSGNRTNIQKGLLEQVTFPSKQFNRALTVIWVFLSSLVFFTDAMALLIVLRGGYGELYMAQGDTYSASSIVVVFEYFFFAMAMTYGNARNRHLYIILFVADGLFKILGGGRGAFRGRHGGGRRCRFRCGRRGGRRRRGRLVASGQRNRQQRREKTSRCLFPVHLCYPSFQIRPLSGSDASG